MRLRSAAASPTRRSLLGLAFAASIGVSLALPPAAHAQSDADRATARALGQEGQQALDNKDYATAEDRFRRADKMVHAPTLMLGLARALAAEGKYVEAQEAYNRIIREGIPAGAPEAFKRALEDAKKEVESVTPKVGAVTITVKAAGGGDIPEPQVVLDEHPINSASLGVRRAIDPGAHVLRATAEGYKAGELKFSVPEGGSVDEPLTLEKDLNAAAIAATPAPTTTPAAAATGAPPAAEGPSSTQKMLPWIGFGVGAVGIGLGAITGGIAIGKHNTLKNECPNSDSCADTSTISSYHTMGTLSTVGFIVGGVGVAAGVVLLLVEPKGTSTAGFSVAPTLGLGSVGATGTF